MRKLITQKGRLLKALFVFSLVFFQLSFVFGQAKTVSGVVTDSHGESLVGVSVKVKGAARGISTDMSGRYAIQVSGSNPILIFSYLGFTPKEIAVAGKTLLNVSLTESLSSLKEVVVIGYGTTRRSDLTGAVGGVSVEDLSRAPVKSFDEALAGRVAGVQVRSSEGQPGSAIDIVVRGYNSITQNNYPLFVIDGFPMEDPASSAVNPLNTIDPNEIESIDILKDASATAIYGARGANGVVMVTTKRGKIGAPVISYNGYYGWQNNSKRMEVLSPYEFVKLQWEIDSVTTKSKYLTGGTTLESYRNVAGINWEDQVTRTAPMQNHYLSLSGGTERTRYSASLSHVNQRGIIINSGFKRTQGKFAFDQNVNKKFKVGFNATYADISTIGSPSSSSQYNNELNLLFSVWAYRPVTGIDASDLITEPTDPEATGSDFRFNPILTTQNELRDKYSTSLIANAYAEYNFTNKLKFRIAPSFSRSTRRDDSFNGALSRSGSNGNFGVNGSRAFFNSGTFKSDQYLTYANRFNKSNYLNLMAGLSFEKQDGLTFGGTATNLINESLGLSGLEEGVISGLASTSTGSTLNSYFGRAEYKLTDRYLFTATMRADGSSRFRKDHRWGYFPSAAFGWIISNEGFMKKQKVFSNAKLRTSWGLTGNNQVGNFATYTSMVTTTNSGYMFNNADNKGMYTANLGNTDLKWETTEQIDLGLDLGFLHDRASLTVDLYSKQTENLLLNARLPASTGFGSAFKNIGAVKNEGLEITLNATPLKSKSFSWNSSFNIAFNRNEVTGLAENQTYLFSTQYWGDDWVTIPAYIAQIGAPISRFYGLLWDGVYGYDDFTEFNGLYTLKSNIPSNGEPRANVKPGDIKYKDINGDLVINDQDKTVIGRPYPIHTGGFSNNFSYKGFDLNVFFQWSYGNDILNANRVMLESGYKYNTNQFASYANRWSPSNTGSSIPAAQGITYKSYSTRVIEDGSFLRLKTVQLGYSIPARLLKSISVKSLRAYVAAQNLYTWTKYSGYDPEVSVRNSALTPGFDYSAYPRARTLTFGLTTSF